MTHLDEDLLNFHVRPNNHAITPRSLAKPALCIPQTAHTHRSGEQCSSVGDKLDFLEVSWVQGIGGVCILLF